MSRPGGTANPDAMMLTCGCALRVCKLSEAHASQDLRACLRSVRCCNLMCCSFHCVAFFDFSTSRCDATKQTGLDTLTGLLFTHEHEDVLSSVLVFIARRHDHVQHQPQTCIDNVTILTNQCACRNGPSQYAATGSCTMNTCSCS